MLQRSSPTAATAGTTAYNLDCLRDLPPYDPSATVRLYLSRHGETENNRLGLLQGARIDAPVNPTGERQAGRLGRAWQRARARPELVLHSPLQRARETARIAARQTNNNPPPLMALDSLAELDFGAAAEGEPVEARRAQRLRTYAAWAAGRLDARMATGGESGREVRTLYTHV